MRGPTELVQGRLDDTLCLAVPMVSLNHYLAVPRWTRWGFYLTAAILWDQFDRVINGPPQHVVDVSPIQASLEARG